ncbi:MAG: type II secretion system protein [Ruminiclostridium sp.]|nr:type II secretion system protein [Ruminiclostridium sp.]
MFEEGSSIKNQKGFTVIEVLLALIVIGLITVIVTQLLGFNINSSKAFSLYGKQQYTVQDAFSRLNNDIHAASQVFYCNNDGVDLTKYKTIKLYISETTGPTPTMKCLGQYKLEGKELLYRATDGETFKPVVQGLLEDESTFVVFSECLTVVLVSEKTSTGRNAMNLEEPIVAQYSLKNKFHMLQDED